MTANNETPIMGNCLSCQGLVRVPATAPTTSTVKCPHCDESFQLSQILNQAVPELKIVEVEQTEKENEDEEEGAAKDAEGRFVVAKQLRQSSKKSRRGKRRRSSRRRPDETDGMVPIPKPITEADLEPDSSTQETASSQFAVSDTTSESPRESFDARRSSRSSSRSSSSRSSSSGGRSSSSRTRPSSGPSAMGEIIKVVIGGALAIPIAYLLVLWVFKQDPLFVAPKIYQTAPFLVPAEFRGAVDESSQDSDDLSDSDMDDAEAESGEVLDVSSGL